MKICTKCKIEKNFDCFKGKNKQCKKCLKKQNQYYLANKEILIEKQKIYDELNKEKKANQNKQYREANKAKLIEQKKLYYQANKERISKQKKLYNQENKEKIAEWQKEYKNNRLNIDYIFRFKENIRTLIRKSFKKNNHSKKSKTVDILGCSMDFFKDYIQSKLKKGMTLENHGEWHLDHIIPLATAKTEEDVIRLNHYTNFQPLWAKDNLSKSAKIIEKQLVLI